MNAIMILVEPALPVRSYHLAFSFSFFSFFCPSVDEAKMKATT